ncbi:MAG: GIY-YIG nuclease family protein [Candidatus Peregrinibacteria bacterium]
MRDYYVYILKCSDGSTYTGVTNDYQRRLYEHQSGCDPRSYTYSRRPVQLAYVGIFGDINEAISWEKRVKRWSRKKKEALIRGDFEALPELSRNMYCKRIDAGIATLCKKILTLLLSSSRNENLS